MGVRREEGGGAEEGVGRGGGSCGCPGSRREALGPEARWSPELSLGLPHPEKGGPWMLTHKDRQAPRG